MDSKHIEQLLEKYWNCETSLEEEQELKDYFRHANPPDNLKEAAALFRYFDGQQKKTIEEVSFDADVKKKLQNERPWGKFIQLNYLARIAAGLAVVVAATYFVREEVRKSYPPEVSDTYTDPKIAFEETKKALMMISKGFGKAQHEAGKINLFNEAEQKIQQKPAEEEKKANI
jgi:hypothetical protein